MADRAPEPATVAPGTIGAAVPRLAHRSADFIADVGLYRMMVGARIRSDWQYRTSFITFLVGQGLVTVLDFVTIVLLLDLVPGLGGWSATEVVFLYGLASVPFGVADLVVSAVERVGVYVQAGTFDRLLLRPVPALLQISALEFELRRAGKIIPPLAVLVWAIPNVDVDWTVGSVVLLAVALICGTAIYSALWILSAALSFWVVATKEATYAATYGGQFANQYPLHLYRGWIRAVLGWAIPLAFVAYVPAVSLLDAANPLSLPQWLVFASVPVAGLAVGLSMLAWTVGIRHYQSTGS
ncbi:MAG: ABC transporter permease [Acidimicrobiales bacterium]